MKKTTTLFALVLLFFSSLYAQTTKQIEPSFSTQIIKPSELIVEGTVTAISYFRDTTTAVRNYRFYNAVYDRKGVWFIKYEITIHKLFKGEKLAKVTVINPSCNLVKELENLYEYPMGISNPPHNRKANHALGKTAIFFLTNSFAPDLALDSNFYYLNQEVSSIGSYDQIKEISIDIMDQGKMRKFETLEYLYKYLEKEIGKKGIAITDKKFEAINTTEKYFEYKNKYFNDSNSSEWLYKMIKEGKINQMNKDSFTVKPKNYIKQKNVERK